MGMVGCEGTPRMSYNPAHVWASSTAQHSTAVKPVACLHTIVLTDRAMLHSSSPKHFTARTGILSGVEDVGVAIALHHLQIATGS